MIRDRSETSLWYRADHLRAATILFHGDTATSGDLLQRKRAEKKKERHVARRWQVSTTPQRRSQLVPASLFPRSVPRQSEIESSRPNRACRPRVAFRRGIRFGNLCRADKFYQASVASVARPRGPVNHAGWIMRLPPPDAIEGHFSRRI